MTDQSETVIQLADGENGGSTAKTSPEERLKALQEHAKSDTSNQAVFIAAALNDSDEKIRCTAISLLMDLPTLEKLLSETGAIHDAASLQYLKVLAGNIPSEITDSERTKIIQTLDAKSIKQVALLAKCKAAAATAISLIDDNQELADLCLFAASVHVRKPAAEKIDDVELINELKEKTDGKDKTVFKVLSNKLNSAARSTKPAKIDVAANDPEHPSVENKPAVSVKSFDQIKKEIESFYHDIDKLSHKNTGLLIKILASTKKFKKIIEAPDNSISAEEKQRFSEHEKELQQKLAANKDYQAAVSKTITELIGQLQQALDDGHTKSATQLWDKIQGGINNTSGAINRELSHKSSDLKQKVKELRDWKNFAATEKKKEIIDQMQHLHDSKMHPADKARKINKLHAEWKSLGHSSQNEKLWRQFKTVSDKAFLPCREHFKQQKEVMEYNLKKRNKICEQLETYLQSLEGSEVNLSSLKKLENQAKEEWKQYAPVENSKIKKLQKRFYGALDKIRKIKRNAIKTNTKGKKELIAEAEALVSLEDKQAAMSKAKDLQSQWKEIGPTTYKDDRKYWEAFRAACDKVFAERDIKRKEVLNEIEDSLKSVNTILKDLEKLLSLDDDEFRQSRKSFPTLQRNFHEELSPKVRKERKQLIQKFEHVVTKIEVRNKNLPDKKQQQTRSTLEDKAAYCLNLETKFSKCRKDGTLAEAQKQIDDSAWKDLQPCIDRGFDKLIEERFQSLKKANSVNKYKSLLSDQESLARHKVVELEIKANLDSPEVDKELRMQVQLNQLKNNFGKGTGDKKSSDVAREFELEFLCLGPLEQSVRNELEQRVEKAVSKLAKF